jgi:hypothetical protein
MEGSQIISVSTGFAGLSEICNELADAIDTERDGRRRKAG